MNGIDWATLSNNASKVFTPAAPVDEQKLFSGRIEQLRQVVDVVNQKGQHAIIFGERGVGKTSLANIIVKSIKGNNILAIRKNCDSADDYSSLWKKIASDIVLTKEVQQAGFTAKQSFEHTALCEQFEEKISPDSVVEC